MKKQKLEFLHLIIVILLTGFLLGSGNFPPLVFIISYFAWLVLSSTLWIYYIIDKRREKQNEEKL